MKCVNLVVRKDDEQLMTNNGMPRHEVRTELLLDGAGKDVQG